MYRIISKIFFLILILVTIFWTLGGSGTSILGEPALALSFSGGLENTAQNSGHTSLGVFGKGSAAIEPGINLIINVVLSFVGVLLLILMIYGGFMWMTAAGNEDQVGKAQKLILAAIIGMVIVVSAYAISYFIISQFGGETLKK